jgi:hypothetical protein
LSEGQRIQEKQERVLQEQKGLEVRASRKDKIFLSYRRDDSSHATDRIYNRLVERFGKEKIFYDVDTLPYGEDWRRFIIEKVNECGLCLVVIGDHWIDIRQRHGPQEGQRRLEDPNDVVRVEIEAALEAQVKIIPVFVGRGSMPREEEVPHSIQALVQRNAAELRAGPEFSQRLEKLVIHIESEIGDVRTRNTFWSWLRSSITTRGVK